MTSLQIDKNGIPLLDQFSEEGFVDCVLKICGLREDSTHYHFHMAASKDGVLLGVDVRVVKEIGPGFDENMNLNPEHVYREGVVFTRSGPESDRLLVALASLYESSPAPKQMKSQEAFTAIALHKDWIPLTTQPIKLKLFGNDDKADNENAYYESFFNLHLSAGLVFWNEKDQEYRRPLLNSLSSSF